MQIIFKIAILLLLIVIIVDLLFYVPIDIYLLLYKDEIHLYLYTIPIIVQTDSKKINKLKNKISIEKILNTKKEDLRLIKAISLKEMNININKHKNIEKLYFLYGLIGVINSFDQSLENIKLKLSCLDDKESYFYIKIRLQFINIFYELIKIRRIKRERTSNKRNIKKFFAKH